MARYPLAVWKPLNNRVFRSMPRPVRINLHTAVSNALSLQGFFNKAGRTASHFYVRADGVVEQYVDTRYRAACDLEGNPDTISIETWDGYPNGWRNSSDVPAWTPAQVKAITGLIQWIWRTHGSIPRKRATSNARNSESHGLSYHRLGVPGYMRYSTGLRYSSSRGKVCPGDRRIAQIPGIYQAAVSGAASGGNPAPAPTPKEDILDMDKNELEQLIADTVNSQVRGVMLEIIGTEKRYGEYIDEDGKGRDFRTLSDYWLATHSNAVQANRTLSALAAREGLDEKAVITGVLNGLKPAMESAIRDLANREATVTADALIDALIDRVQKGDE